MVDREGVFETNKEVRTARGGFSCTRRVTRVQHLKTDHECAHMAVVKRPISFLSPSIPSQPAHKRSAARPAPRPGWQHGEAGAKCSPQTVTCCESQVLGSPRLGSARGRKLGSSLARRPQSHTWNINYVEDVWSDWSLCHGFFLSATVTCDHFSVSKNIEKVV
jgi:hypothetical protein